MGVALGAWLSALAGALTGVIDKFVEGQRPGRKSLVVGGLLGSSIAVLCYGVFLAVGAVLSVLTFGTPIDPLPALIGVLAGCVLYIPLSWLVRWFKSHFGLTERRRPGERFTFQDVLDARARGGPATMWLGGVVLPLLPVVHGLTCLFTLKGQIGSRLWHWDVEGGAAIALGLGWIAVGAFLHFHFFFGLHPSLEGHSRNAKVVSLVVASLGLMVACLWSMVSRAV